MMLLLISLTDTLICMSHQSQIHSHAYFLYSKIIHGLVILFTVSLEMNLHLWDVHVPQVCWIPQQRRTVCSTVRNAPLRRAFHSSVLCASLILVYPYCSKSFECTDCTWTWSAHSGANFCPERQDLDACGNMINLLICYSQKGNWVQAKGQNRHFIFSLKGKDEKNVFEE